MAVPSSQSSSRFKYNDSSTVSVASVLKSVPITASSTGAAPAASAAAVRSVADRRPELAEPTVETGGDIVATEPRIRTQTSSDAKSDRKARWKDTSLANQERIKTEGQHAGKAKAPARTSLVQEARESASDDEIAVRFEKEGVLERLLKDAKKGNDEAKQIVASLGIKDDGDELLKRMRAEKKD